jgi:hypothetical protein
MARPETRKNFTLAIATRLNPCQPPVGLALHSPCLLQTILNSNKQFTAQVTAQVLLTMGGGRSTLQYFVMSPSVHRATAVRWRHVVTRSSCLNGKLGPGRLNAVTLVKANF